MKRTASLVALMAICATAQADDGRYAVGLIGDTPYSSTDRASLPTMLEDMARDNLAFIIHDGDFKNGSSVCSDEVFQDRLELFNASPLPFIFVPGDNEWTDCHRITNGRYRPNERLAKLRDMFFRTPESLGKKRIAVESQSTVAPDRHPAYREHLRWGRGPVLWVTLNVPGSDNNIGNPETPSAEYLERSAAVADWIKSAFTKARENKQRGIVFIIQADPEFNLFARGKPNPGYRDFLTRLRHETARFSGEVILVHGDSHTLTIDQPLLRENGKVLDNFTRIQTYGFPFSGWVRLSVDEHSPKLFSITPHPR